MRGRPRMRTVSAGAGLELYHEVFGTCAHAYRVLGLGDQVGEAAFKRYWQNKTVSRETHLAVERAFRAWAGRVVPRLLAA